MWELQETQVPRWGGVPGGGSGNTLRYSCLGNPMDRRAWRATVHGVIKNQTQMSEWGHMEGLLQRTPPKKNGRKITELLLIPICYITLFEAHHYYLTWKNFTRRKPLLTSNTNMSVNIHISNYLKSESFPLVTLYITWYIICILNKYKNYCELITSLNDNNQSVSSNPGTTHPQSLNWS